MRLVRAVVYTALVLVAACGGGDGAKARAAVTPTIATSTTAAPTSTSTSTTTTVAPTTAQPTTSPPPTSPLPPPTTVPTPPPVVGGGRSVFVLGDSVLLGVRDTLPTALPGWDVTVDTLGSRRLPQGIEVLRARRAEIGAVVVIMLGNNYIAGEGSYASQIDQAMGVLTGVSRVVWLTLPERWESRVAINAAIRAAPSRWPTIVVAEWAAEVAAHPEYAADMLHLGPSGRAAINSLIAVSVGPAPP
jgi:hypothetical protein